MSLRVMSPVDVKMPRAMTSRSTLLSQSSTWFSQAGVGRREVQANVLIQAEELADALGLVSREVVKDDVDLFLGADGGLAATELERTASGQSRDRRGATLSGGAPISDARTRPPRASRTKSVGRLLVDKLTRVRYTYYWRVDSPSDNREEL
jgi:hypothetical protein